MSPPGSMYWLRGDEEAGGTFFGPEAELLTNPLWQDGAVDMPEK